MVVLIRPIGYTNMLSFLLYHTETIPAITAINSNQVVCNKPLYIDSNREVIVIVKLKHFKARFDYLILFNTLNDQYYFFFIPANCASSRNISSRNLAASIKSSALANFSICFLVCPMAFSICGIV